MKVMIWYEAGETNETETIEVQEVKKGVFKPRFDEDDDCEPGFSHWDEEVENTDSAGDACCQLGISQRVKWQEVELDLENREFRAPSIERLREALSHVVFCRFAIDKC